MASPWIGGPVSHIFNLSYLSVVPVQWKRSCITPVPITAHPAECKDFRPIPVTPVLSRVTERLMTYTMCLFIQTFHICFVINLPYVATTAALIYLFHQLTHLLQKYVHLKPWIFSRYLIQSNTQLLLHKLLTFP